MALFPVGIWVTRSSPEELGLVLEGVKAAEEGEGSIAQNSIGVTQAVRSHALCLLLGGSTLVVGAIGAEIQHFILFLKDAGFSSTSAARFSTILLASSLGGRVIVGHLADRFRKTYMAFFYFLVGASAFLLASPHLPVALWTFAIVFGFSMGGGLYAHPAGDCGVLRNGFARQAIGTPHHGIFDRAMCGSLDGRENF
jgi:MFS transporter, OFA family, oxalate/formate antiporter